MPGKNIFSNFNSLSILKKIIILCSIFFLLILTFLPFYDQDNLITILHISNHLYSFRPVFLNVGWPGGPFFLIAWVPTYLAFIYSGFELWIAYITLKLILLAFLVGTALILSKFFNHDHWFCTFIFLILNPAMIYITLIWAQFDIIPVFFSTLTLYYLRKEKIGGSFFRTIIAFVPMFIAIFTTYYPLLFIPALIFYSRDKKEKISILFASIFVGFLFLIFDLLFFRGFSFSYIVNLNGNGLSSSFYEGLQYFISIPLPYYIIFLGVTVILVPVLLHKKGYGLYTSIYVLLLLFLYTSASAGFDVYLWLIPFTVLAVTEQKSQKIRFTQIFILNVPIFVEALFSNFIMGTGIQQGIFYFGYEVFHVNYLFVKTANEFQYFITIFNSILMTSIVGVLIILLTVIAKKEETTFVSHGSLNIPFIKKIKIMNLKNVSFKNKWFITIVLFLLISAPVSIIFNNTYENIYVHNHGNAPLGIFYPSSSPTFKNFVMSVSELTYVDHGNSIQIFPLSPELYFSRNLSNEHIDMNFTLNLTDALTGTYSLINSSIFSLSYLSVRMVEMQNYSISPNASEASFKYNYKYINGFGTNIATVYLNGSSFITYDLNSNFSEDYHIIAFQDTNNDNGVRYLWFASNHNITKGASLLALRNELILSYGNHSLTIPYQNLSSGWNYVLFKTTESGFLINVNGVENKIVSQFFNQNDIFKNNSYFTIGYPSRASIGFIGNVSPIYSSVNSNIALENYYRIIANSSFLNIYTAKLDSDALISISDANNRTDITLNGAEVVYPSTLRNLTFGKLTSGYWGLNITFHSLSIIQLSQNNYYLVPVFYFTFFPYFLVPIIYLYFKQKFR